MILHLVLKVIDVELGCCGQPSTEDEVFGIFSTLEAATAAVEVRYSVSVWEEPSWDTGFGTSYRYAKSVSNSGIEFHIIRYVLDELMEREQS